MRIFAILGILTSSDAFTSLRFLPTRISTYDVALIVALLVLRGLWGGILSIVRFRNNDEDRDRSKMRQLALSMPFDLSRKDVEVYLHALRPQPQVQLEKQRTSASQLCLYLSAFSEPAMLLLLAKRGFPLNPLGAVNVRNRLELLHPNLLGGRGSASHNLFDFTDLKGATILASHSTSAIPVKHGFEYTLSADLIVPNGEGEQTVAFRQIFTVLEFRRHKLPVSSQTQHQGTQEATQSLEPSQIASLEMERSDPLKWAQVCKDYNPIHIFSWAARAFGMPGAIAHGNHILARTLYTIEGRSGNEDPSLSADSNAEPAAVEVEFRRPVTVPARLDAKVFYERADASTKEQVARISIENRGKLAVKATLLGRHFLTGLD